MQTRRRARSPATVAASARGSDSLRRRRPAPGGSRRRRGNSGPAEYGRGRRSEEGQILDLSGNPPHPCPIPQEAEGEGFVLAMRTKSPQAAQPFLLPLPPLRGERVGVRGVLPRAGATPGGNRPQTAAPGATG